MQKIVFLITGLFVFGCASLVDKAKVGDCLESKYESGTWKVVKNDGEKLTVEEVTLGKRLGEIKFINKFYGGWEVIKCEKSA